MKFNVWSTPGVLIIHGAALQADEHKHHALQIVWPADEVADKTLTAFAGETLSGPVVIGADVKHCLSMPQGWVVLVEPQSNLGVALERKLQGGEYLNLENLGNCLQLDDFSPSDSPLPLIIKALGLPVIDAVQSLSASGTKLDARIEALLNNLNQCFGHECVKPDNWRAMEVAAGLELSESRFLHLFRQEMGMAWRPYLLWRRLLCAVSALKGGQSATKAAHLAGFSDSAHLSRTFRSIFGMSIRQASHLFS